MRCPRCGNDNPDAMRFCGMCGGTLLSPAPTGPRPERGSPAAPQSTAPVTATATRPPAPPQEPRSTENSPSISGPSFLGLSEPPTTLKRADLSIDPHRPGSRNLDYLLDDDDHHHGGGGAGKFFLIVLALLLAVGLGYLRWKNQLPPWLNSIGKKPAATTQTTEQPPADTSAPTPPSTSSEPQPATSQPAASQPAANAPSPTAPAGNQPPPANQPAPSASATPPAANSQPPTESAPKTDSGNPPDTAAASTKNPPPSEEAPSKKNTPAAKSDESSDDADSTPAETVPSKPKSAPMPIAKPRATIRPADSIAEARKYLYGKGAAQDCDRGLRLLKPMANEGNSKAMVEMGALYSAGLCTPHDLPTSYRWFAMALRKDPSNEAIQGDLQKLWGEMTQPERQLAIKLTQ